MTPAEWDDILEFVEEQWPNQWKPEQAVAFYRQLAEFDPVDVHGALLKLFNEGRDFAPNGSVLRHRTIEERRHSYRPELQLTTQSPGPVVHLTEVVPAGLWAEAVALHGTYGRGIPESYTPYQFTVNVPVEKWPQVCLSPLCRAEDHQ